MTIRMERDGAIVHLIIARPEVLNAMNKEMYEAMTAMTLALQQDTDVRVVILRSEGRAFCSGSDVSAQTGYSTPAARQRIQRVHRMILGLANLEKPMIAAVRGICVGVGWSMAMCCDLIVASTTVRFGQIFKKVGLAPDGGAAYFLQQAIGAPRARELVMSARMLEGEEALQLGLINELVADDQLEARAIALANELAEAPTFALAMAKRLFRAAAQPSLEAFLEIESHVQNACMQSDDHREGANAFREKRKAKFVGH